MVSLCSGFLGGCDKRKDLAIEARSFIGLGVEGASQLHSPVMEMNR